MSCSGGSKSTPAAGAPDKRTHILALFAAAEAAGYTSVTLSEARAADSSGGGDACRDLR